MEEKIEKNLRNLIGKEFDIDDIIMAFDTDKEVILDKIDYTTRIVYGKECDFYNAYINDENSKVYNIYVNIETNKIEDID